MLSHNLKRLRDFLEPYGDTGAEVAPAAMGQILAILEDGVDKAQDLEVKAGFATVRDRVLTTGEGATIIAFPTRAQPDDGTGGSAA